MQRPYRTHLIHGFEHFGVTVDDDCDGDNEAEEGVADEIAVVAPRSFLPAQRAGGLDSLGSVGAPAKQRSHGPKQAVDPHTHQSVDASPHAQFKTSSGFTHHDVALVGEQGQSAEGNQT